MKVSIIIPTYKRDEVVNNLLARIDQLQFKNVDKKDIQVIIVDQYNKTNIYRELKGCSLKFIYSELPNLPNARNIGIRNCSKDTDILIFLDDDIEIDENFVDAHLKEYNDPSIGAVAGKVIERGSEDLVSIKNITGNTPKNMYGINFLGIYYPNRGGDTKEYVLSFPGGNFSIRRDIAEKIGFFDVRFQGSFQLEETDYAYRIRKAGYKIIFSPEASLIHLRIVTGGCRTDSFLTKHYWRVHNTALFMLKHKLITAPLFFLIFPVMLIKIMVKFKYGFAKGLYIYKGMFAGIKSFFS